MSVRQGLHRWGSPTIFAFAALCFLLPFATVLGGCESDVTSRTSFTGIQLVTRSVPRATGAMNCGCEVDAASGRRDDARFTRAVEQHGAIAAEVAFGAAIVGLVLGLLGVAGAGWCAVAGIGVLVWFALSWDQDYEVRLHAGFWLALLLFVWAGILHLVRWKRRPVEEANAEPESATPS